MDNAQQQLTRIEKKLNLIGSSVIGLSAFILLDVLAEIIPKDVSASWKLIAVGGFAFLCSSWSIYMTLKFREAGD